MLQAHILKAMTSGQEAGRHLGRPLWGPLDRPVETADGLLAVAIEGEQTRRRLSEVCGLRASENRGALEKLITERLRGRSAAEWELLLLEAGIPAAVIPSNLADLPRDPRVASLLERVEDACWVPAAPWQLKT